METNLLHIAWHDDRCEAINCRLKYRSRIAAIHVSRTYQSIIAHGAQMRPQSSFHPPWTMLNCDVSYLPKAAMQAARSRSTQVAIRFCFKQSHMVDSDDDMRKSCFLSGKLPGSFFEPHCIFRPDVMMQIGRSRSTV
jgi:hypothetical protein